MAAAIEAFEGTGGTGGMGGTAVNEAIELSIAVPDPFDWHRTMTYPQLAFAHPLYRVQGERLQRVLWLGGRPWLVTLGPATRRGDGWRLRVAGVPLAGGGQVGVRPAAAGAALAAGDPVPVTAAHPVPVTAAHPVPVTAASTSVPTTSPRVALAAAARHIVSADHDLTAMASVLGTDPVMAALVEEFRGVRLLRLADIFEAAADAVIGQQISVAAAHTIRRRLMAAFNPGIAPLFPFPHPADLAAAPLAELAGCGLGARRAEYLAGVATLAAAGNLPDHGLKDMPLPEALARLTAIRGVGRWTAELTLLFGVGRTDVWPAGDLGLRDALAQHYGRSQRPTEQETRDLAWAWSDWAGYAAYYLWGARRT